LLAYLKTEKVTWPATVGTYWKVYVSHDVTFVETPETSGRVMIQVGGQVPESEEAPMNNVEAKLESERTQLLRVMLGRSQGLEVPRKRLRRVHLPNFASQ